MSATRAATAPGAPAGGKSTAALWLLLGLFMLVMPSLEALKNVAAGLFMLLWMVRAVWTRDAGGRWDAFDTAFALMVLSACLSAWRGYAGDLSGVLRVLVLAWLVTRTPFSQVRQRGLLGLACLGLLIGLAIAVVPFARGTMMFLELPSVGHVNQSGLYLALLASACLGWVVQGRAWGRGWLGWAAACGAVFGLALLISASRAAILAYAVYLAMVLALVLWQGRAQPHVRRLLLGAALALTVLAGAVVALGKAYPKLSGEKLQAASWASAKSVDHRVRHWRLALEGWRQRPWLGSGPEAFQQLTPPQACQWRSARGEPCDEADYSVASHAHSLYFATLAERGLVGLAVLVFLLGLWAWALARSVGEALRSPLWMASAAGLVVVTIGGLFSTTLRVEHGSLALLTLALWLAARRPAAQAGWAPSPAIRRS